MTPAGSAGTAGRDYRVPVPAPEPTPTPAPDDMETRTALAPLAGQHTTDEETDRG